RRAVNDAESEVPGGAVGRARRARRQAVAVAVRRMAEVGAALHDPACVVPGLGGVQRATFRSRNLRADSPEVLAPLPDVADNVVEAEAVGLVGGHRCGPVEAIARVVAFGELTLPDVTAMTLALHQAVAPGEATLLETATARVLPLGLG